MCLNNVARIKHGDGSDVETGLWESLGGGCDAGVLDMEWWGDDLYLAGNFENCGGTLVNFVTAYGLRDGTYRSLNNGLDDHPSALEYFQGRMIVAGFFHYAGGLPVTGIAAWDGNKWRALEAACTDDCVPGELNSYFTLSTAIEAATQLKSSRDGSVLYAQVITASQPGLVLGQWKYFGEEGDGGRWTIKGGLLQFGPDSTNALMNNGTQLVVVGQSEESQYRLSGLAVQSYSLKEENWVDNNVLIGDTIFVVRSSASTLRSSFFLSFLY